MLLARKLVNVSTEALNRTMGTAVAITTDEYWMPFTNNRSFKKNPKIISRADGVFYYTDDGKELYDGISGLWCVNAGHNNKKIISAVQKQVEKLDFVPSFNISHELPYKFSKELLKLVPNRGFGQVFFTMCGSTAVDTSMKMALAYHRSRGEGSRVRFIGRERGYHGVGFGGISIGGILSNRKAFSGASLPFVDHLPHTHSLKDMAFSKGLPNWGLHLADELERIIALHDASTIAAVFVEPVPGSTGVLPPPKGYLQKLREICDKHGILLVFDEVINGFGRLGKSFATEYFDVTPDMITCAKGLTNSVVPQGAVISQAKIYKQLMDSADKDSQATIEFFHGYTYTGHPLAMAAGIATLEVYQEEGLFERANDLAPYFQEGIHSLKGLPNVIDIRNVGLMGAIELAPIPGNPSKRGSDIYDRAFEKGVYARLTGNTLACAPPLISTKAHIDRLFNTLGEAIVESSKAF